MEGSRSFNVVSLIVWLDFLGIECFGLQELFEGCCCFDLHQIEYSRPVFIESKDRDSHNAQDPNI